MRITSASLSQTCWPYRVRQQMAGYGCLAARFATEVQFGTHEWLKRASVGHRTRSANPRPFWKQFVSRMPCTVFS